MAQGAGFPSTLMVESEDQLDAAAKFLVDSLAPRFLCDRVHARPAHRLQAQLGPHRRPPEIPQRLPRAKKQRVVDNRKRAGPTV